MKKTFFKFLPLTAAVLLATSCSKDENNDERNIENQPKVEKVVIPFSVKVNTGNSISKIAYTKDGNDVSKFNVNFEDKDVKGDGVITMAITGDDIENTTLTLTQDGSDFKFVGDITLKNNKTEEDFTKGNISISGSFGMAGSDVVTSITSLADVMSNCSHQYTTTFASNATTIELDDNYAYLEISCASTQTKFQLTIGGSAQDYTPHTTNKKIWFAIPDGTLVTGNMITTMTVEGGKVYRADRTKEVDLGPGFSVLWMTCNLGADNPGEYGLYYTWGDVNGYECYGDNDSRNHDFSSSNYQITEFSDAATAYATAKNWGTGYRMPTDGECQTLANIKKAPKEGDKYSWTKNSGATFKTSYGSVFLPAAGYCHGSDRRNAGSDGFYCSSTPYEEVSANYLRFGSVSAYVGRSPLDTGQSVRAVRCMN